MVRKSDVMGRDRLGQLSLDEARTGSLNGIIYLFYCLNKIEMKNLKNRIQLNLGPSFSHRFHKQSLRKTQRAIFPSSTPLFANY